MLYTSVYGHSDIKNKLTNLLELNDKTGSYLFCGPLCVGKRTIAFETARYLLCIGDISDNCSCDSCRHFPYEHPDFFSMGVNDRVRVEDIDRLLNFSVTKSFISDRKVAVIDNAENMTWAASNRLLKLLEEPPQNFSFFIVTAYSEALIDTIRSRCINYNFGVLSQEHIINVLYKKLGFDLPKARILGWIASGSSIDVFSKAGQYLKFREMALDFVSGFKTRRLIESLDFIDKIIGKELPLFVDMVVLIMTDILLLKNNIDDIINADMREQLGKISNKFKDKALVMATNFFEQVKKNQHLNINMNLALKNVLIKNYSLFSI